MRRETLISIIISLLLVTEGTCGQADKPTQLRVAELEPIVITASRCERTISKIPSSIDIISAEEIEKAYANSTADLLKDVEGIYVYDSSGVGTAPRLNMRGFWGGMSTHQLVLVDGIPQGKAEDKLVDWNSISLDNIEKIEVLKGPSSALYGDNAMSGVINIITKKPAIKPEAKLYTSYGNFNTQNYKISTSATFGKMGYLLSTGRKVTRGFRRHSDYEDLHLNSKLNWDTEIGNLELSLSYYRSKYGAHPWALTQAQIAADRRQARPGTENDKGVDEKVQLGITHSCDLTEASRIKSIFYIKIYDDDSFYTSASTGSSTKEYLDKDQTYGLILQYESNGALFSIKHSFIFGIDLERNEFDYQKYAAPYQARGSISSDYVVDKERIGPFIQEEINLIDSLIVILGLRYDLVKFDFKSYLNESNSKKRDLSDVSPKLGIVYQYREDSALYGNYSYAFRTPTLGQMFTYSSSNPDLEAEEAVNYELGIRHRFKSSLKGNLALFYTDLENEILYDYATSQYKNLGRTSHAGLEARLNYQPFRNLNTFLNYTYLRAKYENRQNQGNYLEHIPKHKTSIGLRYNCSFGLMLEVAVNYTGNSYLDSANTAKLSDYAIVDTKFSYKKKNWTAFLSISNLFNKEYDFYGFISSGSKKFNPAPERTFTLGLTVKF
jgi:iron complex outermembrane receptor protein